MNPDPASKETEFGEVSQAYEVLSDLQKPSAPRTTAAGTPTAVPPAASARAGFSFTDIMDAFFDGTGHRGGHGPGPRPAYSAATTR